MKDTDLYSRILGLTEPWFVEAVELNSAEGHDYVTVVCDLIGSTVEYVADERKAESLGPWQKRSVDTFGPPRLVADLETGPKKVEPSRIRCT